MNQLHCDINDIVSEYLIGVKINPYNPIGGTKSPKWHEIVMARNRNGTKSPTSVEWSFSCKRIMPVMQNESIKLMYILF